MSAAAVRLYAILAREAARAVVFRRGPSKQVLLISWNMETDQFSEGQWLKGRIYERRCDLSPDGELLLYFAASWKGPYQSWSAISRPPYLTALALWPKGNAWGGGGLFTSGTHMWLRHDDAELAPGFKLPKWLKVEPAGSYGEDAPGWYGRLERDGWELRHEGERIERWGSSPWIEYKPPMVWARPHPLAPAAYELQMIISGVYERNGPWYVTEHAVVDKRTNATTSLGRSDWADWCHRSGDILFAAGGQILRASADNLDAARTIADFTGHRFVNVEAPQPARTWRNR